MKIVFFGSDDFALVHLQALNESTHEVCACVTQPDKAKGRGMRVVFSDIKQYAIDHQIPVMQPEDLGHADFIKKMCLLDCDLFVVIAYGRFLPKEVLCIPHYTSINVHASLLPQYRGAAPINWAIINGDKETGLSIIEMNAKMDAGDIIAMKPMLIDEEDTSVSLRARMKEVGPAFLLETIKMIGECKGNFDVIIQEPDQVSFASKIRKPLGLIDWGKPARDIHNLVKGLLPWPTAYTYSNQKLLKILKSQVSVQDSHSYTPGEVIAVFNDHFTVATQDKALEIYRVHLESSKPMDVSSFLLGHKITPGMKFE